jgi:hypothetical protein
LIQAKDMQDAVKIQSEFFQEQMRTLTEQARSAGESAMKQRAGCLLRRAEPIISAIRLGGSTSFGVPKEPHWPQPDPFNFNNLVGESQLIDAAARRLPTSPMSPLHLGRRIGANWRGYSRMRVSSTWKRR